MKNRTLRFPTIQTNTAAALILAITASVRAGTVESIQVGKTLTYVQTTAGSAKIAPLKTLPYSFAAEVDGANRASISKLSPAPKITLPATSRFKSMYGETPSLGLGEESDDGWKFGFKGKDVFDNWGTKSKTELDMAFPNGTYTFVVQGKTVALSMPEDKFPPAPVLSFKGGKWQDGVYRISAKQALTIGSGTYVNYGKNTNDYISVYMEDGQTGNEIFDYAQVAKTLAGGPDKSTAKSYTRVVPAGTLKAGRKYYVGADFGAITSINTVITDCLSIATYSAATEVAVVVE